VDKIKGRKVYETWKKGLPSWEEYRGVVRVCGNATRKAKAHLELNLVKETKDNKKDFFYYFFFKYVNSKRKSRYNVGPLLNEGSVLVTGDAEKVEMMNAFFALVFTAMTVRRTLRRWSMFRGGQQSW